MASLSESASVAQANQLNRELLRWIQSLDLAYSIKNVKRDFANGFLVAEILSRYYDKDISMHSYDNGIGVKIKKDNWDQLCKLFARVADLEPLTNRADIDTVIHCTNGAAVAFITKLYQCLTKRTILPSVPPAPASTTNANANANHTNHTNTSMPKGPAADEVPPYAKPTGAAVIREKMRGADLAEASDESEIHRKVRSIHSQHEEQLQLERLLAQDAADRYPSLRSASKATVLRSATKPVRNDDTPVLATQQVVKEVQIKTMTDKSLEKLRMNREAKETELYSSNNQHTSIASVSFDRNANTNASGELLQKRRPLDLLHEAARRKLPPHITSTLDLRGGKDKFEALVDCLHDGRHGGTDADAAALLTSVVDESLLPMLAAACLDYPRDFAKLSGLLFPCLTEHDDTHPLFLATHSLMQSLGRHCVSRDGSASLVLLLTDSILPRVTSLLHVHANKRAPLLTILYAFASETPLAHLQVLKRLREALANDIPLFIHALAVLLTMETGLLDGTLVDLYHYYCCIGLEGACDKLRTASLSMLVVFAAYDASLVVSLLPKLATLSSRYAWWEVKAQLLVVTAAFLYSTATSSTASNESIELALTIVEREFHPIASLNVRRVGLGCLAKTLTQYQELVSLYVDVLLSLPLAVRAVMLDPSSTTSRTELPIRGVSGAHYALPPLPLQWDSAAIAKQVFYERKGNDRADIDAMLVLHACLQQLLAHAASRDEAGALFEQMKGYIALGLLDAAACGVTAQLLVDVAKYNCASVLADGDVVVDTLQVLATRNVEDIRQQMAVKMLHDTEALGPRPAAAVSACVATLAARCDRATFAASLFSMMAPGS